MENLKINISQECSENLKKLIDSNPEYSCIRLEYTPSHGHSSVEIFLDELKSNYVIENLDDIFVIYDESITKYISSIDIIFKDSSFMVKALPSKSINGRKSCCGSDKNCSNKNGCDNDNKDCNSCCSNSSSCDKCNCKNKQRC